MLKLPPEHPNNWYRAAFTHFLDCPHGNWWILPWHRGFTGYIEQMVRKYSKNPQFAFPYWDWTANPQIPAIMMDPDKNNTLNPNADAFIGKTANFQKEFQKAINNAGYWKPGSATLAQLNNRGLDTPDEMWDQITGVNPMGPAFFEQPNTRNSSPLLDCVAGPAVSMKTLKQAMAPQDFMTFGSSPAPNHSGRGTSGVLEGYPHNKIHNNTGGIVYPSPGGVCDTKNPILGKGFMQWNLSPVDPLFFLHHSNLDRLWDAWVRGHGEDRFKILPPAGPPYYYFEHWAAEPFLFFYDADGNPVTKNRSRDYIAIGDFAYDYQPGSGEPPAGSRAALTARARPRVQRFSAEVPEAASGSKMLAVSTTPSAVRLRPGLLQAARSPAVQAVLAKVTVVLPPHARGQVFTVLVHTGDPSRSIEAGRISLFGTHQSHAGHGAAGFTIPMGDALDALQRSGQLRANALLHFRVVAPPSTGHHANAVPSVLTGARDLPVENVVIEAH